MSDDDESRRRRTIGPRDVTSGGPAPASGCCRRSGASPIGGAVAPRSRPPWHSAALRPSRETTFLYDAVAGREGIERLDRPVLLHAMRLRIHLTLGREPG